MEEFDIVIFWLIFKERDVGKKLIFNFVFGIIVLDCLIESLMFFSMVIIFVVVNCRYYRIY